MKSAMYLPLIFILVFSLCRAHHIWIFIDDCFNYSPFKSLVYSYMYVNKCICRISQYLWTTLIVNWVNIAGGSLLIQQVSILSRLHWLCAKPKLVFLFFHSIYRWLSMVAVSVVSSICCSIHFWHTIIANLAKYWMQILWPGRVNFVCLILYRIPPFMFCCYQYFSANRHTDMLIKILQTSIVAK